MFITQCLPENALIPEIQLQKHIWEIVIRK